MKTQHNDWGGGTNDRLKCMRVHRSDGNSCIHTRMGVGVSSLPPQCVTMTFVCPVFTEPGRSEPLRVAPCEGCGADTVIHPLCPVCAKENMGVVVRRSADARMGAELGAVRAFRPGDLIALYTGHIVDRHVGSPYGCKLRSMTRLLFFFCHRPGEWGREGRGEVDTDLTGKTLDGAAYRSYAATCNHSSRGNGSLVELTMRDASTGDRCMQIRGGRG